VLVRSADGVTEESLDKELIMALAHRFFVRGTVHRVEYGAAPVIQFNEHHYGRTEIKVSEWLKRDVELIGEAARIGFFHMISTNGKTLLKKCRKVSVCGDTLSVVP
jgi:hypothetical protein